MKANIFEIKRFAVHDGPGIRTTVFFKGCPLRCLWCHNPEGLTGKTELAYYSSRCVSCGDCTRVCAAGAHHIENGIHTYRRDMCMGCGKCSEVCSQNALVLYGKSYSVKELCDIALQDKDFFDSTGGGVTLSGGECLLQADFCAELLKQLKNEGIHTAVDTCGYLPREAVERIIPYTDMFLYDLKAIDEKVHISCTGYSNERILENLKLIDKHGVPTEIRYPFVPGYNDGEAEGIAKFLSELGCITSVRVLPYHFPGSKYEVLDMGCVMEHIPVNDEGISACREIFIKYNIKVV